jgi:phage gp29-like protein
MALLDAYGRPVRTQELTREKAAPTLAGVRTIWTDTVASGLTPYRLASLLRSATEGDHDAYLTLAEEMEERDPHYACELGKRKLAVGRLPAVVEAASDSARDIEIADAVRALVKRPGFRFMIKDALDGLGKGFSVVEIVWDRTGSRWWPGRYEWRDPHFFQFDQVTRREIRLRDLEAGIDGLPLAPFGFITHVPKIKSGIPIRGGLARLAAWAFMCKGYSLKDWMAFAEVFGMPLRMGKYRAGASAEDIDVLKMAVANLGSDAAAVFPESMLVELVERKGSGGETVYQVLADHLDAQVSKGILGQTASASGTAGKLGDEKLQASVRDDIRDDDADQLADTLNRDLIRPFVDLNFGPQEVYPTLSLEAPKAEDIKALSEALGILVPLGLRVEQSVIRDKIGLPDPDRNAKPEDLLQPPRPSGTPPVAQGGLNRQACTCPTCATALNAEQAAEPDTAERLAGKLSGAAGPVMDAMLAPIAELVRTSGSLEEIRAGLEALAGTMPMADMGRLLAQALTLAHLAGRAEVIDGN